VELPPLTVALARTGIAALTHWMVIGMSGARWPRDIAILRAFAVMGLLNNVVPFGLIFWGQTHIDSGLAAILNATTPLFTVIVAHVATRDDALTPLRGAGVLVGFLGVTLMVGPDLLREIGANVAAQLSCLGAALSYAVASVYGRRFREQPPLVVAGGQLTSSTLILLPLVALVDRPWEIATPRASTIGAVLALAIFSTALAYLIFFRILAAAGATSISLVTFLIPVSAILLGATFLGETLAPRHFAGMAAIGFGLAAIDGRILRIGSRVRL
jgi:drug/metabolite transporter (DMT)-like permease